MSTATANGNGTITKKQPEILGILGTDTFKKQLALALPRHMTPDRFARIAITAIRKTPKLQQCTIESLLSCLMSLSQYGLEPDGRRAHLIPYENRKAGTVECTLILDYKGIAELALRSGLVSTLHADVVQEGDIFDYSMGKISKHVPHFLRRDKDKPEEAGKVYAVYAMCENKDGTTKCEVMSLGEVNGIMRRSKSSDSGPWKSDWSEMAKKTAFRRLSKWLVLSPEFRDAVSDDEDRDVIDTTAMKIEHTPVHLAELVGGDSEKHEPDVKPYEDPWKNYDEERISHVDECSAWLKEQNVECVDADPAGNYGTFKLPNGSKLIVSTRPPKPIDGIEVVDAFDDDAITQVMNIVANAAKPKR